METRIYETDDLFTIVNKIFEDFEIGQSVSISGFVIHGREQKVRPKGEVVLEELRILDESINAEKSRRDGRIRRKRKIEPDSIGGYVAQKIWKYKLVYINEIPRYTIWRFQ